MADYGVNIKVGVQGQNNAKQLGEQIREIVRGLEAADRAFTQFSNNLKSFDQRRAQRKINEELDKTAQKYRELDRLQRQLLANDNSAIKSAERRAKLEEFISKNISAGRMRRRAQFLRGDPAQYPSGANQPFAPDPMVAIRAQRNAEAKFAREIFNIEQSFARKLNNTEIDLLTQRIKRELDAQQQLFNNAIRLSEQEGSRFDAELARRTRKKREAQMLTGQTSPIGGAVGIPGSPAALQAVARRQKIGGAISSGLIGGGFPLLFGQGGAAAAGGLAGGLAGGAIGGGFGFALSIVGTAIGQAVADAEEFNKTLVNLNSGLNGTATNASITSGEISVLAEQLGLAKEETIELLTGFKNLGANTEEIKALAQVFGDDASTIKNLAASKKLSQVGEAIFDNVGKIGKDKAKQLINELKIKDSQVVQLGLIEAIAKAEEDREVSQARQVKLTDRIVASLLMAGAGAEAMALGQAFTAQDLANERADKLQGKLEAARNERLKSAAEFVEELRGIFNTIAGLDPETGSRGRKADPTPGLRKRLNILKAQIEAEQKVVGLSSEGAAIVRRKLAFEKRLAEIRETGIAERQKFTDQEDIALSRAIERNGITLATLQFERDSAVAIEKAVKASERLVEPLEKKLNTLRDRNAFEREYGELIMNGSTPAAAKQVIEAKKQIKEIDELVEKQLRSNEIQINILRIIVAQTEGTDAHAKAQEALNDALERQNKIIEKGEKAKGEVKGKKSFAENIEEEIKRLQGQLNELIDPANQVIAAANAIGDAFTESFRNVITGSMSAQEALANFFQRTADHFIDMAMQMIAYAIKMKVLGIVLNAFGGAAAAGAGGGAAPAPKDGSAFSGTLNPPGQFGPGPGFAPVESFAPPPVGDFNYGVMPVRAAEGGYFASPTRALIGEGGEPEFVIPQSKMRESMARYSRGARGSAVISESGASGTSGEGGGTAVAAPIDVRFNVERINNVDYVTAEEFQIGMQRAASQGAQRGQQLALTRLQQSPNTRRRLGL